MTEPRREEFEQWYAGYPANRKEVSWEVWKAAYATGERSGRIKVLKDLSSAMKKVLPAEMVAEIVYRADPLSVFLKEIDAL